MSRLLRNVAAAVLTAVAIAPPAAAQDPAAPPAAPGAQRPPARDTARVRRYSDVITRAARTDSGVVHVHWVAERLYFEVPDSLLGRDWLLTTSIAATPRGLGGFAASGSVAHEHLLRWERRGDRLLLRLASTTNVASDSLPVARSVRANNLEPIIMAFAIAARSDDSLASVIEATPLYRDDVAALSPISAAQRRTWTVRRLDPNRTLIDYARSYPLNVEVRHTLTYDVGEPPSDADAGAITIQLQQSLILLPRVPYRARLADPRVGWFSTTQVNFGLDVLKADSQTFINRWRLEPSDQAAYDRGELTEPVKPIEYYIDPATPARWRPWVRRGIEDWQPAFEAAGFRRGIVARDAPDDSTWTPEDVRYASIRWAANLTRNAVGPSVADPRSGEIIDSDVIFFHNHIRSYRNRLILETGAANPNARSLELADSVIGETIRAVIAHEVGHALGLPHNMIASSGYPTDSLRSPAFTQRWGLTPTIMDYARQNYIAQPGDGPVRFVRMMGPYDLYAINWGYRVIPGTTAPAGERAMLDRWIREREGDRRFRYGPQLAPAVDPDAQTEDLGDDPVKSSGYGIANLKRVLPNLPAWTAQPREDWGDLRELYGELVGMWSQYTGHVQTLVGGTRMTLKTTDVPGTPFAVVPREQQRAAVDFLVREVFTTPAWLVPDSILRRFEHTGALERVRGAQQARLNALLDFGRLARLLEQEAFDPRGYKAQDLFDDLRRGIWSELDGAANPDVYRRGLQRAHLERLEFLLTQEQPAVPPQVTGLARNVVDASQSDIRMLARAQLVELQAAARRKVARTTDRTARAHFADVAARIERILNPA